MADTTPLHDKNALRAYYQKKRVELAADFMAEACSQVSTRILALISGNGTTVAGYRAISKEVDIANAYNEWSKNGLDLCLPVVESPGKPLLFRRWQVGQPLEIGHYGVEVPPASEPVVMPDVVIVPLVAFDRLGHRIGFGAGYYDRTIAQLRQTGKPLHIIGVAYSIQEAERIPADAHDAKLDMVVTEKEIIECR